MGPQQPAQWALTRQALESRRSVGEAGAGPLALASGAALPAEWSQRSCASFTCCQFTSLRAASSLR